MSFSTFSRGIAFSSPFSYAAKRSSASFIHAFSISGSVPREDFFSDSDIDILVEFEPDHVPGLAFYTMQRQLAEIFGRKVDMNTAKDLSPYFREEVLEEAEYLYVAA